MEKDAEGGYKVLIDSDAHDQIAADGQRKR